jgi:hypothetical protein
VKKLLKIKKCFKLSEVMVGSGIWKKPIPDPGGKKVPDPGSGTLFLAIVKLKLVTNRISWSKASTVVI